MGDHKRIDRRTVLQSLAGAGVVGLVGVGSVGAQEEEISVTGVWTGGEEEDFVAVAEHVEEETDVGITYEPRDTESILTGTLTDFEAGVATADIVVFPSEARVRSDAERGHLEPLEGAWEQAEFAIEPDQVSVEGQPFAAPFKMDLKPGFWYRQSFFEEHGLEEPEDYDQFLDLLGEIDGIEGVEAPIASGNGQGWPLSDLTEAFILRQEDGAELQRGLIEGDAEFTDDRVRQAFTEIQELHQQGYFSDVRDFGVQFEFLWENQIPLYFQGSFTPAFEAIQEPEDLGVFRLPGTEAMVASVNWFTVPTYSESVEAAVTAAETFASADAQQVWAERGGFIASNLEVPEDAYQLEVMADLSQAAGEVELVPDLDDALGDPFQSEFWSALTGFWAEPDQEIDPILESLNTALEETVEEDGEA